MLLRREFMVSGAAIAMLGISGCANNGMGFSLVEAIRRLLMLSSQRALARLMAPNGFYDSQVARISLPDRLGGNGGGSILTKILLSQIVRDRLYRQINRAAERGAERAAPVIAQAITSVSPQDALAIVRAGGSAATGLLQQQMGSALITAMVPGIDEGLHLFDSAAVTDALKLATGIDFAGLRDDVTRKASDAIFAEMGQEEIAIRADPAATHDPVLMAVFGLAK
ncbi:MAG: DUF4197 domain-containing protein [Sphingobium sp.]